MPGVEHKVAVFANDVLRSVSQSRFSENPESVNPEIRETLGFPFHKGRELKLGKEGKLKPVSQREGT